VALLGQTAYGPNSTVPAGASLGPHTATGSGKITLWATPGLFGVTLDAVQGGSGGLSPSNASLPVGTALTYTATGQLTPVGGTSAVGSVVVGTFPSSKLRGLS